MTVLELGSPEQEQHGCEQEQAVALETPGKALARLWGLEAHPDVAAAAAPSGAEARPRQRQLPGGAALRMRRRNSDVTSTEPEPDESPLPGLVVHGRTRLRRRHSDTPRAPAPAAAAAKPPLHPAPASRSSPELVSTAAKKHALETQKRLASRLSDVLHSSPRAASEPQHPQPPLQPLQQLEPAGHQQAGKPKKRRLSGGAAPLAWIGGLLSNLVTAKREPAQLDRRYKVAPVERVFRFTIKPGSPGRGAAVPTCDQPRAA
jgi:hypothetical protein